MEKSVMKWTPVPTHNKAVNHKTMRIYFSNYCLRPSYKASQSFKSMYRKTSSISRTKFQNLNVTCIILQLSSLNPLKPGVKLRMKM